ncbi:MAG: GntR family transcriptional regulator, partial [Chloroflexi bacterium]|nr:GntR family transcriptional regulator [Chloroflexota bacterium]
MSEVAPVLAMATRSEQLAEMIRLDIVRNRLPPGERVTEEALAERYGVSRTPVREALRVLTRESLLRYVPRTGYIVASVDLDEMDDLYTVRIAIEEQVATRIVTRGIEGPLRGLLTFWEATPEPVESDINLVYADEAFHETLAEACGSTVFPPLLRNINQRLHRLRIRDFIDPERVRRTYVQHATILRGLLDRDARLSRALLRAHIWESHSFV